MDDIVKMLGYFVIFGLILLIGTEAMSFIGGIVMALAASPLGILVLLIIALAILKLFK